MRGVRGASSASKSTGPNAACFGRADNRLLVNAREHTDLRGGSSLNNAASDPVSANYCENVDASPPRNIRRHFLLLAMLSSLPVQVGMSGDRYKMTYQVVSERLSL